MPKAVRQSTRSRKRSNPPTISQSDIIETTRMISAGPFSPTADGVGFGGYHWTPYPVVTLYLSKDGKWGAGHLELSRDKAEKLIVEVAGILSFMDGLSAKCAASLQRIMATEFARERDEQILQRLQSGEITHDEAKQLSIEAHRNPWPDTPVMSADDAKMCAIQFAGDHVLTL